MEHGHNYYDYSIRPFGAVMAISIRDALRWFSGGYKIEEPLFKSEQEAYDFCRSVYDKTGGATEELRRSYEFYLKNYHDDSREPAVGPANDYDLATWRKS